MELTSQWKELYAGCPGGGEAAVGSAGLVGVYGHKVRLRHRNLRRVYGSRQRCGGSVVSDAASCGCGDGDPHD